MKRFDDLYLFTRVVEAGGFSAAERATGIPKSRLSRRIAELETQLGTRLLQRSSHRVSVTPVGEAVYRHARDMADASAAIEALAGAARSEPAGVLRVGTSPLLAETLIAGWLAEFADAHPKLRIELDLSNNYVDLIEQRIDVAIRAATGPLPSRDVVARPLAVSPRVLVGSPTLIARVGGPLRRQHSKTCPAWARARSPAAATGYCTTGTATGSRCRFGRVLPPTTSSPCVKRPSPVWALPCCPSIAAMRRCSMAACAPRCPAGRPSPQTCTRYTPRAPVCRHPSKRLSRSCASALRKNQP